MSTSDAATLLGVARDLAGEPEIEDVAAVVCRAARALARADGVAFVVREGDEVHYVDEEAIAPLWKGSRVPASACISGWAMNHRHAVAIADIESDERIPLELYRRTFVRSLVMVPIGGDDPVAAIGAYWARRHVAVSREMGLLEALAGLAAVVLSNASLRAEVRRIAEARDDFLVVASHELRTPLSPLKLRLQSALRRIARGDGPDEVRDCLLLAENQLERLSTLADGLLEASRVVTRKVEVHPQEVDLGVLACEVARRFQASGHGPVAVRMDAPVRALVDPGRTAQVLGHLLSNAAKFGAGRPVSVRIDAVGAQARLVVCDDGIGIAHQDQARIFERFERAASDLNYSGLGLGLWLAREIVKAHGGSIEVHSCLGQGAAFTVLLPLAPHATPSPLVGAAAGKALM